MLHASAERTRTFTSMSDAGVESQVKVRLSVPCAEQYTLASV